MRLALIDIDGVIADDGHRSHFYKSYNFTEYFSEENMAKDTPIEEGRELIRNLVGEGYVMAYLTGRREDRRQTVIDWLGANRFPNKIPLLMRPFPESELKIPLAEFKANKIQQIVDTGLFEEITLWDDDPRVIELVQKTFGEGYAVHCTWRIKDVEMIRHAVV